MGFFDRMFKSENNDNNPENKSVPWIQLTQIETLEEIAKDSFNQPIAILKHSTSCGISRMVLRQFEQNYNLDPDSIKLYFLDLLRYRDISNKIASRFNVPHESPQLIMIKDGKAVYDASHSAITIEKLKTV
ncbi:bacillithiol system protein YtxJ [Gillisia sp. Hel_I_86]|uniref:bacillithiol system redox-active protein YtxJ n=1 Tax=Gillisia sp. Hel_I_86 TaxID=1249981 RepID=UPI001199A88F|nr:bacillithiol system redox-active protein YtxJ [Gillisia sp. Hel_I_86]TVZ28015.1 bacillithiol system protein YtxJ [Gillisia sp. Hel_I_86]